MIATPTDIIQNGIDQFEAEIEDLGNKLRAAHQEIAEKDETILELTKKLEELQGERDELEREFEKAEFALASNAARENRW